MIARRVRFPDTHALHLSLPHKETSARMHLPAFPASPKVANIVIYMPMAKCYSNPQRIRFLHRMECAWRRALERKGLSMGIAFRIRCFSFIVLAVAGCSSTSQKQAFENFRELESRTYGGPLASKSERPPVATLSVSPELQDYLKYAALNNPGLEAAFNRWKAALEKSPQVTSLPDPKLTYAYFIERVETRVGPQRQRFGLAQTFPWFGKLRLRGDIALAGARAAYEQFEAARLRVFYSVKDAYFELYYLARALAITGENMDLVRRLEGVARSQYKVGGAQHADVIRAQVELGKLEDQLRTLKDLRQPIVARLNAALNRAADADVPWPTEAPQAALDADDPQILAWMREVNPELKALDAEIEKQQTAIQLARKDYFPDVTLGVDYVDTGTARRRTSDSGKDAVAAKVSINLPIWHQKYRAAEREARARKRAALRQRENKANSLMAQVKLALFKFRDAERKIDLYHNTLVPKAEQSLRATETAYRAGKMDFLNLIDAERLLLTFRLAYERALSDKAQRLAEVEMLVGRQLSGASGGQAQGGQPQGQ